MTDEARTDTGYDKPIPDILSQIKDSYSELRPAERRVADVVLNDVATTDWASLTLKSRTPSQPIARQNRVTVASLRAARRAISALDASTENAVERQVDPAAVVKAAELVASAHQVAVFGLGGSSAALAQETQYRPFRYGVVVSAHSDTYIMRMTASTLKPNDLVIAISATGRTSEVIEAMVLAKHYRAKTICITAPDTDLTKVCDVRLTVDIPEYPDTMKPTASRFAFLAITTSRRRGLQARRLGAGEPSPRQIQRAQPQKG